MKCFKDGIILSLSILVLAAQCALAVQPPADTTDPYLWMEEREGQKVIEWVKNHDSITVREMRADSRFATFEAEALKILNSKDDIPTGQLMGGYIYNFWEDENHIRGIYRRCTLEEYAKPNPVWETVLDIDSLNTIEGKSWVFQGADFLPPQYERALITLSDGGKDAAFVREFDAISKTFVVVGFSLPEAKSWVSWVDMNSVLVGTDFGSNSLTASGYPRIVKLWKRGTPISEAHTVLEGDVSDVWADGSVNFRPEGNVMVLRRAMTFWESENWIVGADEQKTAIPLPKNARINSYFKGYVIATLHSNWLGFSEGSIVGIKLSDMTATDLAKRVQLLFKPDEKSAVTGVSSTKDYLIVSILENVRGKVLYFKFSEELPLTRWPSGVLALPLFGSVGVATASDYSNTIMVTFQDFLTPTTLYLFDEPTSTPRAIKNRPTFFDAGDLQIVQGEATSVDGTVIPYFMVSRKDMKKDGSNPTLLYGYGGFRASETPFYSGTVGKLWLEGGGVFVLANIRGGGEFGARWHKAALLENRQKSFDDFIAVGQDLISEKITSPKHLGIMGGSNGGLLVGAAFTQRPDLFNAVVCQVPLLDMLRYTKLPPGASWAGEYGDPDSANARTYIEKYSPYQNVRSGVKYPKVLFVTSTRDDRVHPGHARKTAAKLEGFGNEVYFFEETEGGHAASADNIQRAKRTAMEYTYLWKMLGK